MRNLRGKVPDTAWPDAAIRARACYEAASPALATVLRDNFVQVYERDLPAAVRCFLDDFEACIAHLRFPLRHRKVVRTTNLLERLFLAFGERPVLKLMYAAVIRAADRCHPRRARPRSHRADRARRQDHLECITCPVIQQGSDLTSR